MSTTYQLKIIYTQEEEIASWDFNDKGALKRCNVEAGDKIHVTFNGPGDVAECVVLCGQLQNGLPASPFVEGNRINLKDQSTLTLTEQTGLWGFSIAFTARNADATTSFYYVPDPEVEVSSKP